MQGCQACMATGRILGPLSKRGRWRSRNRVQSAQQQKKKTGGPSARSLDARPERALIKCKACEGLGIRGASEHMKPVPGEAQKGPEKEKVVEVKRFAPARQLRVVIVGGGIGGCALALALQHRNIQCTVLEKDPSFDSRAQGYGLTMQQASTTLRRLGLHEALLSRGIASVAHASFLPDGTLLSNYGRHVHSTTKSTGGNGKGTKQRFNVQIPRQDLRMMVLRQLHPGTVQWSSCFSHYELGPSSSHLGRASTVSSEGTSPTKVLLEDGRVLHADLLVGADGIFSRVRNLKNPDASLRYLGVIVILGRAVCTHQVARNKVFQTLGGETRLYAMPFRDDVIMWQLSFPLSLQGARELSRRGRGAMKEEALRRCGDWHDPIPQLLRDTSSDDITGYPAYDLPPPTTKGEAYLPARDESKGKVVLIGDAIHPMSPFKGQGANQALLDAWTLASLLASERDICPISIFENEMASRVLPKVTQSAEAAGKLHSQAGVDMRASKLAT